jgi:methionine-rich copper-binding protein CopC
MKAIIFGLALVLSLCDSACVMAHDYPDHTEPAVGSTVQAPPAEVRIWFNDVVNPVSSDIQVFDAAGAEIDRKNSHVEAEDKTLMVVSLPPIKSGTYKVVWHALCLEGHHTEGDFKFTVK